MYLQIQFPLPFYSTSDFEFDREGLGGDLNHLQIQISSDSEYMHIELVIIDHVLNYGISYIKNSVFKTKFLIYVK